MACTSALPLSSQASPIASPMQDKRQPICMQVRKTNKCQMVHAQGQYYRSGTPGWFPTEEQAADAAWALHREINGLLPEVPPPLQPIAPGFHPRLARGTLRPAVPPALVSYPSASVSSVTPAASQPNLPAAAGPHNTGQPAAGRPLQLLPRLADGALRLQPASDAAAVQSGGELALQEDLLAHR